LKIEQRPPPEKKFRFLQAFELNRNCNLSSIVKTIPEGIVICSSELIAGQEHVEAIMNQAERAWEEGLKLARNASIDLLMRITCRGQIQDAVELSGLTKARNIAIFGLANSGEDVQSALNSIQDFAGSMKRRDDLLSLDKEKEMYLRKIHNIPKSIRSDQLVTVLKEKSVLLAFDK
jgi:tRNA threonylcarbamoyladenosine modification (KEOPS) complex Cgi121 subunit